LPVNAAEAPESIKCGRCGHVLPLAFSDALRSDARVDACPVCRGTDFYIRKDFDPKVNFR
jgi:Zn finger protein HypA/HybF involved in hydrogenase expression